jgi:hypothetical protein
MSEQDVFRIYSPDECGTDGYPFVWHRLTDPEHTALLDEADMILPGGVKDLVRALAHHRCERCLHPFRTRTGLGRWSRCDLNCQHEGPHRWRPRSQMYTEPEPWTESHIAAAEIGRVLHDNPAIEIEAEYRILTVHHLNGAKADLRWWNLASLCQRCHLQIQGKVLMDRVWPWEHSDWFKPHAAGWYAFAYLDQDLTREEVIERMDELLALESAAGISQTRAVTDAVSAAARRCGGSGREQTPIKSSGHRGPNNPDANGVEPRTWTTRISATCSNTRSTADPSTDRSSWRPSSVAAQTKPAC